MSFTDPLKYFFEKDGIDISAVNNVYTGQRYCAVMLNSGEIGVCATLMNEINAGIEDLSEPDLENIQHRVLVNAYFNAVYNYNHIETGEGDIFEVVDFNRYVNIVMVGFFRPLVKKFHGLDISLKVFDNKETDSVLTPLSVLKDNLERADAVILTATSIFNNSFREIIDKVPDKCEVFLLGPSSILHNDLFQYKNLKTIFGLRFDNMDLNIIEMIKLGKGSKDFLPLGQKVFISNRS